MRTLSNGYGDIFTEMFKLINIMLTLLVGTAAVERSVSQSDKDYQNQAPQPSKRHQSK